LDNLTNPLDIDRARPESVSFDLSVLEESMDTEKKPDERTHQPKANISDTVGDLVIGAATVLANTAATAVVNRVKKASKKTAPSAVKKAKRAARTATQTTKKARAAKKAAKKTVKKSATKKRAALKKKKSARNSKR
jgi:hypothetical protein